MGKMFNTLVLSGLISIVLFIIDGSGVLGEIAKVFISPTADFADFIINALKSELGILTSLGLGSIVIGTLYVKQDWLIRVGMFAVLLSWVEAPFIQLWTFVSSKILTTITCTAEFGCNAIVDGSTTTTLGMIVAGLMIGPIILYAFWACWSQIWSPESSG